MSDTVTYKATAAEKGKGTEAGMQDSEGKKHTTVDLRPYVEQNEAASPVLNFAIEANEKNTEDNPDRESTNVLPVLVRRVNSEELLPRPFKSTSQLVCISYLSLLCCCAFGAWAVKYAWNAKLKRNSGVYTSAIKEAKRSCCCLKLALVIGILLWIEGIVLLSLYFSGYPL